MRRYYYEYYAASLQPMSSDTQGTLFGPLAPTPNPKIDTDRIETIRRLKSLTNCALVAGGILHKLIAVYFRKNPDWGIDWFVRKAGESFDQCVEFSRDPNGNSRMLEQLSDLAVMLEFHYEHADADDKARQAREKLLSGIRRFFITDSIVGLCHSFVQREYSVEQHIGGISVDDCAVGGQVDLVGCVGGITEVIDWKMGRRSGYEDSLQLILYGWWASRRYSVDPANVRVRRVYLGDGEIEEGCVLSDALIRRAKARIIQDIELMKDLHAYGQTGNEEAFTPCKKEKLCRQCKYQQVCGNGSLATSSKQTCDSLQMKQQNA